MWLNKWVPKWLEVVEPAEEVARGKGASGHKSLRASLVWTTSMTQVRVGG